MSNNESANIVNKLFCEQIIKTPIDIKQNAFEAYMNRLLLEMTANYGVIDAKVKFLLLCDLIVLYNYKNKNRCLAYFGHIYDALREFVSLIDDIKNKSALTLLNESTPLRDRLKNLLSGITLTFLRNNCHLAISLSNFDI